MEREYAIGRDRMDLCLRYGEVKVDIHPSSCRIIRLNPVLYCNCDTIISYSSSLEILSGMVNINNSNSFYHFNEFVFPICELKPSLEPGTFEIAHFLGTGFSIGDNGFFLSAAHVINSAVIDAASQENVIVAMTKRLNDGQRKWFPVKILKVESRKGRDLVIGKLDASLPKFFSAENSDAYGWEDVHVFGYPDSRKKGLDGNFEFNPIFLKGYITRRLEAQHVSLPTWTNSCELNFAIPLGVSGSPVFRQGSDHSLIGIALGSVDFTTSLYEYTEVDKDKGTYRENTKQVQQFGVAMRIYDALDWEPEITDGKSLRELF